MNRILKKTSTALAACLFMLFIRVSAQDIYDLSGLKDIAGYWEASASIGANQFLGDLGGNIGIGKPLLKDYKFKANQFLGGLSFTYNINSFSAINTGFNMAMISNSDSLIHNTGDMERWRWYRNLSFKSTIYECYATATFYPIMYFHRKEVEALRINPYVSMGIGVLHFNPKANLDGTWYELQPLNLEGQGFEEYPDRKPYSRTQFYIPINVGVKYYFNNRWALSGGMFMRKTFTDYMDDISTTYIDPALFYKYFSAEKAAVAEQLYSRSRTPWKVKPGIEKADQKNKDSYVTFQLTLSFRLGKQIYIFYPRL